MKLEFFASPADIKALFHELEEKIELCYIWGFSVPCPDVLNVFSSCDEIDCFGYALDSVYWIDVHSQIQHLILFKIPMVIIIPTREFNCTSAILLQKHSQIGF